jgi:cbb3-type cytochrome oxidase maturation protein
MDITFYLFFIALLVSFAGWCVFLWAIRSGQFHDVEDIKYQVWPREPEAGEQLPKEGAPRAVPPGSGAAPG